MTDVALQHLGHPPPRPRDEPDVALALRAQKLLGAPPIPDEPIAVSEPLAQSGTAKLRAHGEALASHLKIGALGNDIKVLSCRQRLLFEKHVRRTLAISIDQAVDLMQAAAHGPQVVAAAVLSMQLPMTPLASPRLVDSAVVSQSPMRGAYVLSHAAIREEHGARVTDARTVLHGMLTTYAQDAMDSAAIALTLSKPV